MPKVIENDVLDLIREDKSDVTIEEIIGDLPKGQQKRSAQEMITRLHNELCNVLVDQKLTETKMKKIVAKLKETDPMKALKQMKTSVKRSKREAEKLALIMLGAKKMCKVMGIELPNIKALLED